MWWSCISTTNFSLRPRPSRRAKKAPPPDIVYEDAHIAALYKPPHLLCHSDRTGDDSLVDRFCAYLQAKGEYDPAAEAAFRPALCNRLDRGTEGLVLAAKDYAALRDMNAVIRDDLVRKEYLTITCGVPPKGRHTAWLRHFEKGNRVQVRAGAAPGYKQIVTDVAVLRTAGPLALCRIGLVTGRTHQIRAHLAFWGAPVLGDGKYGSKRMNERFGLRTQALCAVRVTFGDIGPDSSLLLSCGPHAGAGRAGDRAAVRRAGRAGKARRGRETTWNRRGFDFYAETFRVFDWEADANRHMTPGAILRRAQQIATDHCDSLGMDAAFYAGTHTAFLMAKLAMECYRPMTTGQTLRLETRPFSPVRAVFPPPVRFHRRAGRAVLHGGQPLGAGERRHAPHPAPAHRGHEAADGPAAAAARWTSPSAKRPRRRSAPCARAIPTATSTAI